jgi:hypothetical protein
VRGRAAPAVAAWCDGQVSKLAPDTTAAKLRAMIEIRSDK